MYRIIKMETGETMALTERPNWIRLWQDVYILCGEDKAEGVTVNGTPLPACRTPGHERHRTGCLPGRGGRRYDF